MAVPARLSRKLHDVLGTQAAEDMVRLMDELIVQRDQTAQSQREILAAIGELRDRIQSLEVGLTRQIGDVKAGLTGQIGDVKADLMKWSFLFWVGAVTAIALLANVLER